MEPRGKEHSKDQKDKLVALHKDGQGCKQIGSIIKVSPNMVAKIIQTFYNDHTTENRSRTGT